METKVDGMKLRGIRPKLTLPFPFKWKLKPEHLKDMDQALQLYQPFKDTPIEHGKKEVQHRITMGRTWSKLPEDMSQRDTLQRPDENNQRLESQQKGQAPSGKDSQEKGKLSQYPGYRRAIELERAYYYFFRLTRNG
ncbi:hypothetical protein O181_070029 [Austropuccinia psidii MF-1]|uniref:Uncharacterized protein n=1 Tax=Austropuccinia psidii MF-1 TaxID=1389203 RepID=A0A9Q3F0F7_9BASI|nr:hypothetical protein [Austropuccinia psidii MF-1]